MPSQNKVLVVFGSHDFEFEDVTRSQISGLFCKHVRDCRSGGLFVTTLSHCNTAMFCVFIV